MTAHDHAVHVPGCFRCELSRDEVIPAMEQEITDLEGDVDALSGLLRQLRQDYRSKILAFESRVRAIDKVLDEHASYEGPLPSEMAGAVPDITGGMDSVEFIRQQRQ